MFAGKKSAQIREILISESAWEEMTCLFAPSLRISAAEIGVVLDTENAGEFEKIKMPQIRKDVKRLLHFLDEDYFTSHITRTLYRANSKRREDV